MTIPPTPPAMTDAEVAERLARLFHETYERLAPDFGYRTREASAKPWDEVPEANRQLMIATAAHVGATWLAENARLRQECNEARAVAEERQARVLELGDRLESIEHMPGMLRDARRQSEQWRERAAAAEEQIQKLADVIMFEVPGEPSTPDGAVDVAIRLIRERDALPPGDWVSAEMHYEQVTKLAEYRDQLHAERNELRDVLSQITEIVMDDDEVSAATPRDVIDRAQAIADVAANDQLALEAGKSWLKIRAERNEARRWAGDWQETARKLTLDVEYWRDDRYTQLVGEVERIAAKFAEAWSPAGIAEAIAELRALAATAPQTAPPTTRQQIQARLDELRSAPQTAPAQPAAPPCGHRSGIHDEHCDVVNDPGRDEAEELDEAIAGAMGALDWAANHISLAYEHLKSMRRDLSQPTAADPEPARVTGESKFRPRNLNSAADNSSQPELAPSEAQEGAEDVLALIRRGINDPGSVLQREVVDMGDGTGAYDEGVGAWGARAVLRLLTDHGLLRSAHPAGDEHLQDLRQDLTEVLALDDDATTADDASIVERVRQLVTTELEHDHALAEARREAARLRGEVKRWADHYATVSVPEEHEQFVRRVASRLNRVLAGSSDTTGGTA